MDKKKAEKTVLVVFYNQQTRYIFIKNQNRKYYYKVTRGTVSDGGKDNTNSVFAIL